MAEVTRRQQASVQGSSLAPRARPARLARTIVATCAGLVLALHAAARDAAPGGDAKAGAIIYERCAACHALERDRTGPHHCGLFGRKAGSVPDFPYSAAMRRSGIVWNARTLDRFLANPLRAVPGTSMGYAGVTDPKERRDLIAFLRAAGASDACRAAAPR